MGIVLKGAAEVNRRIANIDPNIRKELEQEFKKIGFFMEGEVKASIAGQRAEPTSVDTGRFLNDVKGRAEGLTATIGTSLDYPEHLEHGTSKIRPRRHFGNSLSRNKQRIIDSLKTPVSLSVKKT